MNYINRVICLFVCTVILNGCSHSIQLTPSLDNIRGVELPRVINKNVGYYISGINKNKEITTPGGGGDKVTYKPYIDSEAALNTILSRVFSKVYSIENMDDIQYLSERNISYVFMPTIITDSYSPSLVTWPPTEFTFQLSCAAIDLNGKTIWNKTVSATGNAGYDEFMSDFSLSARRASDMAFRKMMIEISNASKL